jgi:hypothetical protein
VCALSAADLAGSLRTGGGPFAEYPLAALVLHINREALHHGAEILLLRDLYRNRATLSSWSLPHLASLSSYGRRL